LTLNCLSNLSNQKVVEIKKPYLLSIKISSILIAASEITVPGPKTAEAPALKR
jgi:hypothetical protein